MFENPTIYSDFRRKLSEMRRIKTHALTLTKIYFMYNKRKEGRKRQRENCSFNNFEWRYLFLFFIWVKHYIT